MVGRDVRRGKPIKTTYYGHSMTISTTGIQQSTSRLKKIYNYTWKHALKKLEMIPLL